ncbi:unnamed protein product, partial [Staurois parvus]
MMSGSEILFTNLHVIIDWPIVITEVPYSDWCSALSAQAVNAGAVYERQPAPALLP